MKIAIIGYGVEGKAAYNYWQAGNEITICDQSASTKLPDGIASKLGDEYLQDLDKFDVIVRSPFVRPDAINVSDRSKITSNTNEFLRVCPTRNIIGITGTKGKGTTSTLVTRMLEAAGKRVHLGGNIGVAALDLLKADIQPEDYVVLELSSYQLLDLKTSPHIATCLMVVPEHLDWHKDMAEYLFAKQNLFRQQVESDIAIYYVENERSTEIASAGDGQKVPYMNRPGAVIEDNYIVINDQIVCHVNDLLLVGKHNWQNACAAVTIAWQVTQDVSALKSALTNFSGLPFRIEKRREVNGVTYFNDSFATGPGACLAAMQAIDGTKVMILGGFDRGLELGELATELIDQGTKIRSVLIIGASKERLATVLTEHGFTNFETSEAATMPQIVTEATAMAKPGDAVILSPAFASFGLFENFEDRGRKFNAAVEDL